MMTFFGFLAWLGAVDGGAGASMPGTGTRLSTLAIELPRSITPAMAGLTVGAFVGVVGFIAVMLLVARPSRRRSRRVRMGADQVVFIPPYGTMQRDTPLPPRAFTIPPPSSAHMPVAAPYARHAHPQHAHPQHAHPQQGHAQPYAPAYGPGFRPSTALSARAFAKMGYAADETSFPDTMSSDPELFVEVDMADDEDLFLPSKTPAVTVAPVVVLSGEAPKRADKSEPQLPADKSAPHPLGIIKSSSSAMRVPAVVAAPPPASPAPMRAASLADLAYDDSPTEIGETYFDEPPQPRRRTDPPKIRAKQPAPPRFPDQAQQLPQATPPPSRAATGPRG
jgi:hypothetical protein